VDLWNKFRVRSSCFQKDISTCFFHTSLTVSPPLLKAQPTPLSPPHSSEVEYNLKNKLAHCSYHILVPSLGNLKCNLAGRSLNPAREKFFGMDEFSLQQVLESCRLFLCKGMDELVSSL